MVNFGYIFAHGELSINVTFDMQVLFLIYF
jgi:hypothetical protein